MSDTVVQLEGVRKAFGKKIVLDEFNLEIYEGEMIAIVGSSGSGKSSLLNIIGLLEPLDVGKLTLFGKDNIEPNSRPAQRLIRSNISFIFQNFALVDDLTVCKNLLIALHYVKASTSTKKETIKQALDAVELDDSYFFRKVFELSGGEQQRVALARCLIKPGQLLLADEPTGSLDADNKSRVINLLCKINSGGTTTLVVTHDQEVAKVCDRIIDLDHRFN